MLLNDNEIKGAANGKMSSSTPATNGDNSKISEEDFARYLKVTIAIILIIVATVVLTIFFLFLHIIFSTVITIAIVGGVPIVLAICAKIFSYYFGNQNIDLKDFVPKKLYAKILVGIVVTSLIFSAILACISPVSTWTKKKTVVILNEIVHELENDVTSEIDVKTTYVDTSNVDNADEEILYDSNMSFKINGTDLSHKIDKALYEEAYLEQISKDNSVLSYLRTRHNSKQSHYNNSEYKKIQESEDLFIKKVEEGEIFKNQNEPNQTWYDSLPSENELLNIIDQQVNYADSNPNYQVYNQISNNYQRLALEYYKQNACKATIKYYYYMSLIYDIQSIPYSRSETEFNRSVERIYFRYRDIACCCENTPEEVDRLNYLINELSY